MDQKIEYLDLRKIPNEFIVAVYNSVSRNPIEVKDFYEGWNNVKYLGHRKACYDKFKIIINPKACDIIDKLELSDFEKRELKKEHFLFFENLREVYLTNALAHKKYTPIEIKTKLKHDMRFDQITIYGDLVLGTGCNLHDRAICYTMHEEDKLNEIVYDIFGEEDLTILKREQKKVKVEKIGNLDLRKIPNAFIVGAYILTGVKEGRSFYRSLWDYDREKKEVKVVYNKQLLKPNDLCEKSIGQTNFSAAFYKTLKELYIEKFEDYLNNIPFEIKESGFRILIYKDYVRFISLASIENYNCYVKSDEEKVDAIVNEIYQWAKKVPSGQKDTQIDLREVPNEIIVAALLQTEYISLIDSCDMRLFLKSGDKNFIKEIIDPNFAQIAENKKSEIEAKFESDKLRLVGNGDLGFDGIREKAVKLSKNKKDRLKLINFQLDCNREFYRNLIQLNYKYIDKFYAGEVIRLRLKEEKSTIVGRNRVSDIIWSEPFVGRSIVQYEKEDEYLWNSIIEEIYESQNDN